MTIAKSVHRIQLSLIESPSCSADQLFAVGALLARPDYEDVVAERSIAGLCGYPPCSNALPVNRGRHRRFRVSLSEHRVYDLEETYNYCSEACVVRSGAFSRSLNAERASDLSEAKIEQVVRSFGHLKVGDEELEEGDLGIESLSIKEREDAGAGEVSLDEWIGPANAIEGYVPQRDRIGDSGSNFIWQHNSGNMIEIAGSENYESSNMDFTTSEIVGNEFGDWNSSFPTEQGISDMISKQLENVVLEGKMNRKDLSISRPSKFKRHHKSEDAANEEIDHTISVNVRDMVGSAPGKASFNAEESLEALSRRVEILVITKSQTSKKTSKLSKPKANKKKAVKNNGKVVMESSANIRFRDETISSNQPSPVEALSKIVDDEAGDVYFRKESDKKVTNISNYGIFSEKEASSNDPNTKSEEKLLKSSLKSSRSKAGSHTVKWADQQNIVFEDKKIIHQEVSKEDVDSSHRFTSAEACATALIQAAESVASGEVEVEEAVSEAGILILPQSQSLYGEKENNDDIYKLEHAIVKWPKKTVLLDTDMFEVEDSWHDTTPKGFNLNLSPFATMWMALFGWINSSSLAYIYGLDEGSLQNFILFNGKEYPQKVILRDGQSLEIRQTLDGFICRILPVLVKDQRISVPVSTIEKYMGCLLDTMSFMDAIPSFKIRQWHVIVFLFIEALSVHRLSVLAPYLLSRGTPLQQMLDSAQIGIQEFETMRDLILPFGKSTKFSI